MTMHIHSALTESGWTAPALHPGLREISPILKKSAIVSVLIVDDEALVRWSLAEMLTDEGYAVLQAADGQAALKAIAGAVGPIGVILLDYRLPDTNGLQLLGRIRALSPQTRVVLMTAYGTPEVAAEALRLGATCMVNKPIEMQDVGALVARARGFAPA